jgi:hypothetical protein
MNETGLRDLLEDIDNKVFCGEYEYKCVDARYESGYPCPFCKCTSTIALYHGVNGGFMNYENCYVSCINCKAQSSKEYVGSNRFDEDIKVAIDGWVKVAKRCNGYKKAKWL